MYGLEFVSIFTSMLWQLLFTTNFWIWYLTGDETQLSENILGYKATK
jgi:hypothetical protein